MGSFLGAYLGGVFYEMNGNFDYAWYGSIALSIFAGLIHLPINENQLKDYRPHKLRFNPYLEKLYQSDKPIIIYKVEDGYNIYTDFSKKIILTKNNVKSFLKSIEKKIQKRNRSVSWFFGYEIFVV